MLLSQNKMQQYYDYIIPFSCSRRKFTNMYIQYYNQEKRRLGITPKTALFCCGSERTLYGETAAEEIGVRPIPVWWS